MCCCGKPVVNGQPGYSWDGKTFGVRPVAPPSMAEGDTLIFDEPGRCGGTDCHCHHFRVVRPRHGGLAMLVRHGGGEERIERFCNGKAFGKALLELNSDDRFWTLCAIHFALKDAVRKAQDSVSATWRQAAADGRIKTRKQRGKAAVKVWIEERTLAPTGDQPKEHAMPEQTFERKLDDHQLATILAALRFYQHSGMGDPVNRQPWLHDIATNGGREYCLNAHGIDDLCEYLNGLPYTSDRRFDTKAPDEEDE